MQENACKVCKMINIEDQESLFKLIADYLEKDITCIAIGGAAMMFHGYKTATKDIDLVFNNAADRGVFIKAIKSLGYSQKSMKLIYDEKMHQAKDKPLIYSRGEERFDLFVKSVFGIEVSFESIMQRHDYIGKKELIILTLSKELIILLKSATSRERDYEDIETIAKIEKNIGWNFIISEAIRIKKDNPWILIDLEEKMQKLSRFIFIKKELFDKIYNAEKRK